ncbi:dipeptidase [Cytophagaceae bacterium ABcell3]|nr:dipeptidase [Cytophagaceae bacterium ABcell3]
MREYVEKNQERFIQELIELLKIPSVSADSRHKDDMTRAAEYVKDALTKAGADNARLIPTEGNPVVYAEKIVDESLPVILVYGHYDVQPPDPLNLWNSPPFEPVIKDEKIYARGASDDKGQMYMHVKALEIMLQHDTLPCNVKFMIEGEEEIGSDSLDNFIRENKELVKADIALISDTGIFSNECPTITTGLRGLSYLEVEVIGPNRDLHSGVYGGAIGNPVNILCEMIASLKDKDNHITIPGFYDKVKVLSKEEREELSQLPFEPEAFKKTLGIGELHGEAGYSTLERVSIRPSLDVNGIWGGYIGEGAKTVLPSSAYAKISMRLVPNQSSEEITKLFQEHFTKIAPPSVKVNVKPHHGGEPAVISTNSAEYIAASKAFEDVWGKTPVPMREGGSIPVVSLIEKELGIKTVLLGFGLESDAIHSPNENFKIFNYIKGIETIVMFYKHYAGEKK